MNNQIFNWNTLKMFKSEMYNTLLHKHHIYSNLKMIECDEGCFHKVFLAKKHNEWMDDEGNERSENVQFALYPSILQNMPIRVDMSLCNEIIESKNVIHLIQANGFKSFRINPDRLMSYRELIDIKQFTHSNKDEYTLLRIIANTCFTHRVFCGVSTNSGFGKDSELHILNDLTGVMPMAEMGSTAAMLRDLNPNGALIFNETNSLTTEMVRVCENLIMKAGAGQTTFKNEKLGSASVNTKNTYDIENMSLLFMYNDLSQYSDESKFFDNIWKNRDGVKDRLLRIKLKGDMTERFDNNFNVKEVFTTAQPLFIKCLKTMFWYRANHGSGLHVYKMNIKPELSNRQKNSYYAILHNIDRYCSSQDEFNKFESLFNECIQSYSDMVCGQEEIVIKTTKAVMKQNVLPSPQMKEEIGKGISVSKETSSFSSSLTLSSDDDIELFCACGKQLMSEAEQSISVCMECK